MAREVWIDLSRFERSRVMKWDHYDYKIAEHCLSALINGDQSGMTDTESVEFDAWEKQARHAATAAGFTIGRMLMTREKTGAYAKCRDCLQCAALSD